MMLEAQAGETMVTVAMKGTVHHLLVIIAMVAINNNTRVTEGEIVVGLMGAEVIEDQEVATEVVTAAGDMTAIEGATTGTIMMMRMTAAKVAGDSLKLLQAASIRETLKEPVTLPSTLESEEEEVANLVEILTTNVLRLPPKKTSGKNKVASKKEEIANHNKPIRSKLKKAQVQSL